MKLKDLKTGFLVETRENCVYRVIKDYPCKINEDGSYEYEDILLDNPNYDYLNNYNDDLTHCDFEELDIVKVYQQEPGGLNYNLLWEREDFNGHNDCLNLLYNMGYRYIFREYETLYTTKEDINNISLVDSECEFIQIFSKFFKYLSSKYYYEIKRHEEDGEIYYTLVPIEKR